MTYVASSCIVLMPYKKHSLGNVCSVIERRIAETRIDDTTGNDLAINAILWHSPAIAKVSWNSEILLALPSSFLFISMTFFSARCYLRRFFSMDLTTINQDGCFSFHWWMKTGAAPSSHTASTLHLRSIVISDFCQPQTVNQSLFLDVSILWAICLASSLFSIVSNNFHSNFYFLLFTLYAPLFALSYPIPSMLYS